MAIVPVMVFEDRLLSVTEVAQEFHVTDQTVRNWIDRGVIPAIRAGHAFRIRRSAVEELFERAATSGGSLSGVRRDLWQPDYARLGRRGAAEERAIWDVIDDAARLMRRPPYRPPV
jgi:excisionase family DNA binding protein